MRSGTDMTVVRRAPWTSWPVYWSAIWVGVLAGFAVAVVVGLVGVAVGAHQVGAPRPINTYGDMPLLGAIFSLVGAFASGAVGGWTAARIAGLRRAEPAILHGAIVWLVGIPILLVAIALGGAAYLGGWYSGLGAPVGQSATEVPAEAAKHAARFAVTGLLLGLVGSTLGAWMGSGEPMSLAFDRRRETLGTTGEPEVKRMEEGR